MIWSEDCSDLNQWKKFNNNVLTYDPCDHMTEIDPSILKVGRRFMRGSPHWVMWIRESQSFSQSYLQEDGVGAR